MNTRDQSLKAIAERKKHKERVVFTNGCFDILHVGHIRYLNQARALGDLLVVGVNSDLSVKRLKGESRPVIPEAERAEVLLALKSVDYVILFEEDTPLELIKAVSPDVLVKGGDWAIEKIVGNDFVTAAGGKTLSLPFHPGHSTTEILTKIQRL